MSPLGRLLEPAFASRVSGKPASHISMSTVRWCPAKAVGFLHQLMLPFGGDRCGLSCPPMSAPPPWLELDRLFGRLPCGGEDGTHALGRLAHRVVMQMAYLARRDWAYWTQQCTDQGQAGATRDQLRGVAVPQVVDAQPRDAGGLAHLSPGAFQIGAVAGIADAGEHERGASPRLPTCASRISLSNCRAGALSGTSWNSLCLVLLGGFDHLPAVRSTSAQRMLSTSPRRAPVNSKSLTMLATCWSEYSASAW